MAVIRDIIPAFELYQPASIDDAVKLLDKNGTDALVLAGGLDSMDWLKDRLRRPKAVVDLGQGTSPDAWMRLPDGALVQLDDDNGSTTSELFEGIRW
jgi:CO/xanthine dehydrogenase FAD-binding subunit